MQTPPEHICSLRFSCNKFQGKGTIDDNDDDCGFYVVVCIFLLIPSLPYSSAHATNSAAGLLAWTRNEFIRNRAACVQGKGTLVTIVVYVCIVWFYSLTTKSHARATRHCGDAGAQDKNAGVW